MLHPSRTLSKRLRPTGSLLCFLAATVCVSAQSTLVLNPPPEMAAKGKHAGLLSGDEKYRSEEALPGRMGSALLLPPGAHVAFLGNMKFKDFSIRDLSRLKFRAERRASNSSTPSL